MVKLCAEWIGETLFIEYIQYMENYIQYMENYMNKQENLCGIIELLLQ